MTKVQTCSATGGSFALWVNLVDCAEGGGILSSKASGATGFYLFPARETDGVVFLYESDKTQL